MHTIEFYASMCKCLLVYGLIHSSLPYKQRTNLYTNKRSSIKATSNSKSRAIEIAAKYGMFTTRSLSSWVVLSSTTDLLIYVIKLTTSRAWMSIFDASITRIVCCLPTVGSNKGIKTKMWLWSIRNTRFYNPVKCGWLKCQNIPYKSRVAKWQGGECFSRRLEMLNIRTETPSRQTILSIYAWLIKRSSI